MNPFDPLRPRALFQGEDGGAAPADPGTGGGDPGTGGAPPGANGSGFGLDALSSDVRGFLQTKGWAADGASLPAVLEQHLVPAYQNLEGKIGADKLALPRKDATPEDWENWDGWNALGRPETPDAYEIPLPDGVEPTDTDKAFHDHMRPVLHKAGVTQKQLEAIAPAFTEFFQGQQELSEDARADAAEQGFAALSQRFGDQVDTVLEQANAGIRNTGGDALVAKLKAAGLDNDPHVATAFAALSASMTGDGGLALPGAGGAGGGISTPEQAQAEVNRILKEAANDADHPYHNRSHPEHKATADRVMELYAMIGGGET